LLAERERDVRTAFLVEHYRPGLTADELGAWAGRVRCAADELEREGQAVRYLRATVVPADESLLCFFEAGSEELVREAYARAGIPFERITAVVADEPSPGRPHSTREASG
jgi:hypothetical protein